MAGGNKPRHGVCCCHCLIIIITIIVITILPNANANAARQRPERAGRRSVGVGLAEGRAGSWRPAGSNLLVFQRTGASQVHLASTTAAAELASESLRLTLNGEAAAAASAAQLAARPKSGQSLPPPAVHLVQPVWQRQARLAAATSARSCRPFAPLGLVAHKLRAMQGLACC